MESNQPLAIGTVKGPGDSANQYVFITSDSRLVKVGEFVYYETASDTKGDRPYKILGKISSLELLDHLPDRIFADTDIDPSAIAALIGFSHPNPEIYAVMVDAIGYFHAALGFMNPRRAPAPGTKVFLASDVMLREVLNRRHPQEVGGAQLGSLLLREENAVPVVLDVKEL
ncbi:MAG: ATPase, partial [Cyanobacteria bacterium P01_F01_bin.33]